jgi:hypothetical protein
MSVFASEIVPSEMKFLVLRDLDIASVSRLAEHFVHNSPQFTACIACGPFSPCPDDSSPEDVALALGNAATTIAQLENIVCRVIYLPSAEDPVEMLFKELHLTPNSVNIHGRWLQLAPSLFIGGYTEKSQLHAKEAAAESGDEDQEEQDGKATLESSNSGEVIREMLMNIPADNTDTGGSLSLKISSEGDGDDAKPSSEGDGERKGPHSIFMLDTAYAHTMNQVLFHARAEMAHAGVSTCICPSMENRDNSIVDAKKKIKDLNLLGPLSLKDKSKYLVLDYSRSGKETESIGWEMSNAQFHSF